MSIEYLAFGCGRDYVFGMTNALIDAPKATPAKKPVKLKQDKPGVADDNASTIVPDKLIVITTTREQEAMPMAAGDAQQDPFDEAQQQLQDAADELQARIEAASRDKGAEIKRLQAELDAEVAPMQDKLDRVNAQLAVGRGERPRGRGRGRGAGRFGVGGTGTRKAAGRNVGGDGTRSNTEKIVLGILEAIGGSSDGLSRGELVKMGIASMGTIRKHIQGLEEQGRIVGSREGAATRYRLA